MRSPWHGKARGVQSGHMFQLPLRIEERDNHLGIPHTISSKVLCETEIKVSNPNRVRLASLLGKQWSWFSMLSHYGFSSVKSADLSCVRTLF
jgi:hypothetical protein